MYKPYEFEISTLLFLCIPALLLVLIMIMANLFLKMNKRIFLLGGIGFFVLFILSFFPIFSVKGIDPKFWGAPYHFVTLIVIAASCLINFTIFLKGNKEKVFIVSFLAVALLTLLLPTAIGGILFVVLLVSYGLVSMRFSGRRTNNLLSKTHSIIYIGIGGFGLLGQALPIPAAKIIFTCFLVMFLCFEILRIFDRIFSMMSIAGKQSVTDPLTGIHNRGFLMNRLDQIPPDKEFSILFIDIDNFKMYNDQHGHERGDQVLRHVAKFLKDTIGNKGFACRYGGEEMVGLILTGDATAIAEMFRKKVEKEVGVTVSVGVSVGPGEPIELLKKADTLMYEAKTTGKNKVILA